MSPDNSRQLRSGQQVGGSYRERVSLARGPIGSPLNGKFRMQNAEFELKGGEQFQKNDARDRSTWVEMGRDGSRWVEMIRVACRPFSVPGLSHVRLSRPEDS